MQKRERKILSWTASLAAAALIATASGLAAQSSGEPEKQPPAQEQEQPPASAAQDSGQTPEKKPSESRPAAPARRAVPQVTGTVTLWNGHRIELKTKAGKIQKVAVNPETERLVEIKVGSEVTVEYHRKVSSFIIAERVRPAEENATAAQSGAATAPGRQPSSVTGSVVSWNNTALVLRTETGEVTLFLSPQTEYLVKSLDPGLQVIVEYREGADRAKLATRVRAAQEKGSARKEDDPE
ncbi:MAG TPA: hypothetical protein VF756_09015 [Thermoanaerobaculia bacterium]